MTDYTPTALDMWAKQPFQSNAEQRAAFTNPRYKDPQDQAYRDAVASKLAITSYPDQPRTGFVGGALSSTGADLRGGRIQAVGGEMKHSQLLVEQSVEPEGSSTHALQTVEPFATRKDMVRHMSDPRYSRDEAFRQHIEARVTASDFSATTE